MSRPTLAYAALVLLLVAGPLLWILNDDPSAPSPPRTGAAPAGAQRSAGTSRPSRQPRPQPGDLDPPEPEPTVPQTNVPAQPAQPESRVLLRFMLEGLDPAIPAADTAVTIVLRPPEGTPADDELPSRTARGGPRSTFDVDVTALVPAGRTAVSFDLAVERAGYLPVMQQVSAWIDPRKHSETAALVRVRLLVAGFVVGIVQDERFARIADADVGAFVRSGAYWARVDGAVTDLDGQFRLRLRPGDANLVVVTADGMEPASAQLTGVARAESQLTPFTLRPGLAIAGSVRFADGRAVPGARVFAMPIWTKADFGLGSRAIAYAGGQVLDAPAAARPEAGQFRIGGLVSGDYDLSVSAPATSAALLETLDRRAAPPYEPVDFVLDGGTIVIAVTSGGRPVPRLAFGVSDDVGGISLSTDVHGLARLLAVPGMAHTVEITAFGFEPERRSVVGPAAGTDVRVPVVLRRNLPPPKLQLTLEPEITALEAEVTSAEVTLFPYEDEELSTPHTSDTVAFEEGTATMTGLWAGAWRVVVVPLPESFRLPARARVVLRDGETAKVALAFRHGGRLRAGAHDAAGKPVAATFRVLENDVVVASGDVNTETSWLLPPGAKYRLEHIPPDGEPTIGRLAISADRVVTVDLELPASSPTGR